MKTCPLDIDRLVALEKKATPGPWIYRREANETEDDPAIVAPESDMTVFVAGPFQDLIDGDLVTALRNAAPELLARVKQYEAALREIAEHPSCTYYEGKHTTDQDTQYRTGVTDGHRCAAALARKALA